MRAERAFHFLAVSACLSVSYSLSPALGAETDSPQSVFERRILPIFKSPNPSSCTQCHLASVELKNYILPSHEKTFLSLRDQGLIDLAQPSESKILKLINMKDADNPGANLIHDKVRQGEHEAFAAWIAACAADATLANAPKLKPTELAKPPRPPEVIRHGRKDRLLESFENNIWAMRFRCMRCHIEGTPENDKFRKDYGDRVAWIKAAGAEATMNYLIESGNIDLKKPENSLLLLKPLKVVDHGGGKKFLFGDQGYKAFRSWIDDYAKIVGNKYATAAQLPKDPGNVERFGSEIWLKLSNTPAAWGDVLLQTDIYAWDANKNEWESVPVATSDRQHSAKGRVWQHTLTLMAPKESPRTERWQTGKPTLPSGRYLVKVYLDPRGKTSANWTTMLGAQDYVGQAEFESQWPDGYGRMTTVDASRLRP